MVNFCAIVGCSNRSDREKDRSYFHLPKALLLFTKSVLLSFSYFRKMKMENFVQKKRMPCWVNAISISDLNPSVHLTCV